MAHLFSRSTQHSAVPWELTPLADDSATSGATEACSLLFVRSATGDRAWFAVADSSVRVNGAAVVLGIRALHDRDEIRFADGSQLFFSAEDMARVETFPGDTSRCARCQSDIAPQQPAVRCPQCSLWHHQDPAAELPCWTFRERCSGCTQPTAFDADLRWSPELL